MQHSTVAGPCRFFGLVLSLGLSACSPQDSVSILDYMMPNVCVDDSGVPVALIPGQIGCTSHRNINPGETLPYNAHNFPINASCAHENGNSGRTGFPVVKDGVTRILIPNDQGLNYACSPAPSDAGTFAEYDPDKDGASVYWADDEYGFIISTWSPVDTSFWLTPVPGCDNSPNRTSESFFRGWVLGPSEINSQNFNGWTIYKGALRSGDPETVACPSSWGGGADTFVMWTGASMQFTGGLRYNAFVSEKFSRDELDLTQSSERIYLTDELGLTRWEAWKRSDVSGALSSAQTVYNSARCNMPASFPAGVGNGLTTGLTEVHHGAWSRTQAVKGIRRRWYMTACADWTNVRFEKSYPDDWADAANPIFWDE